MTDFQVLTLWQPWASFITLGLKQYETRSWYSNYRGKLLIHAAKRLLDDDALNKAWEIEELTGKALNPCDFTYPRGSIIAIANLAACSKMRLKKESNPEYHQALLMGNENIFIEDQSSLELAAGNWQPDRFAWKLENIIALPEPILYKGGQGLRKLKDDAIAQQAHTLISQ